MRTSSRPFARAAFASAALLMMLSAVASAQTDKPNILVIWGDDIGIDNVSAYNLGNYGTQGKLTSRVPM